MKSISVIQLYKKCLIENQHNLTNACSEKDLSWKKTREASSCKFLIDMVYVGEKREIPTNTLCVRERWKFSVVVSVEEEDLVLMSIVSTRNRDSPLVCRQSEDVSSPVRRRKIYSVNENRELSLI
jgi:hypothetical protein